MTNTAKEETLRILINKFILNNNLFDLMEAMKVAVGILEENDFPVKKFSHYKYKLKRYEKNKKK